MNGKNPDETNATGDQNDNPQPEGQEQPVTGNPSATEAPVAAAAPGEQPEAAQSTTEPPPASGPTDSEQKQVGNKVEPKPSTGLSQQTNSNAKQSDNDGQGGSTSVVAQEEEKEQQQEQNVDQTSILEFRNDQQQENQVNPDIQQMQNIQAGIFQKYDEVQLGKLNQEEVTATDKEGRHGQMILGNDVEQSHLDNFNFSNTMIQSAFGQLRESSSRTSQTPKPQNMFTLLHDKKDHEHLEFLASHGYACSLHDLQSPLGQHLLQQRSLQTKLVTTQDLKWLKVQANKSEKTQIPEQEDLLHMQGQRTINEQIIGGVEDYENQSTMAGTSGLNSKTRYKIINQMASANRVVDENEEDEDEEEDEDGDISMSGSSFARASDVDEDCEESSFDYCAFMQRKGYSSKAELPRFTSKLMKKHMFISMSTIKKSFDKLRELEYPSRDQAIQNDREAGKIQNLKTKLSMLETIAGLFYELNKEFKKKEIIGFSNYLMEEPGLSAEEISQIRHLQYLMSNKSSQAYMNLIERIKKALTGKEKPLISMPPATKYQRESTQQNSLRMKESRQSSLKKRESSVEAQIRQNVTGGMSLNPLPLKLNIQSPVSPLNQPAQNQNEMNQIDSSSKAVQNQSSSSNLNSPNLRQLEVFPGMHHDHMVSEYKSLSSKFRAQSTHILAQMKKHGLRKQNTFAYLCNYGKHDPVAAMRDLATHRSSVTYHPESTQSFLDNQTSFIAIQLSTAWVANRANSAYLYLKNTFPKIMQQADLPLFTKIVQQNKTALRAMLQLAPEDQESIRQRCREHNKILNPHEFSSEEKKQLGLELKEEMKNGAINGLLMTQKFNVLLKTEVDILNAFLRFKKIKDTIRDGLPAWGHHRDFFDLLLEYKSYAKKGSELDSQIHMCKRCGDVESFVIDSERCVSGHHVCGYYPFIGPLKKTGDTIDCSTCFQKFNAEAEFHEACLHIRFAHPESSHLIKNTLSLTQLKEHLLAVSQVHAGASSLRPDKINFLQHIKSWWTIADGAQIEQLLKTKNFNTSMLSHNYLKPIPYYSYDRERIFLDKAVPSVKQLIPAGTSIYPFVCYSEISGSGLAISSRGIQEPVLRKQFCTAGIVAETVKSFPVSSDLKCIAELDFLAECDGAYHLYFKGTGMAIVMVVQNATRLCYNEGLIFGRQVISAVQFLLIAKGIGLIDIDPAGMFKADHPEFNHLPRLAVFEEPIHQVRLCSPNYGTVEIEKLRNSRWLCLIAKTRLELYREGRVLSPHELEQCVASTVCSQVFFMLLGFQVSHKNVCSFMEQAAQAQNLSFFVEQVLEQTAMLNPTSKLGIFIKNTWPLALRGEMSFDELLCLETCVEKANSKCPWIGEKSHWHWTHTELIHQWNLEERLKPEDRDKLIGASYAGVQKRKSIIAGDIFPCLVESYNLMTSYYVSGQEVHDEQGNANPLVEPLDVSKNPDAVPMAMSQYLILSCKHFNTTNYEPYVRSQIEENGAMFLSRSRARCPRDKTQRDKLILQAVSSAMPLPCCPEDCYDSANNIQCPLKNGNPAVPLEQLRFLKSDNDTLFVTTNPKEYYEKLNELRQQGQFERPFYPRSAEDGAHGYASSKTMRKTIEEDAIENSSNEMLMRSKMNQRSALGLKNNHLNFSMIGGPIESEETLIDACFLYSTAKYAHGAFDLYQGAHQAILIGTDGPKPSTLGQKQSSSKASPKNPISNPFHSQTVQTCPIFNMADPGEQQQPSKPPTPKQHQHFVRPEIPDELQSTVNYVQLENAEAAHRFCTKYPALKKHISWVTQDGRTINMYKLGQLAHKLIQKQQVRGGVFRVPFVQTDEVNMQECLMMGPNDKFPTLNVKMLKEKFRHTHDLLCISILWYGSIPCQAMTDLDKQHYINKLSEHDKNLQPHLEYIDCKLTQEGLAQLLEAALKLNIANFIVLMFSDKQTDKLGSHQTCEYLHSGRTLCVKAAQNWKIATQDLASRALNNWWHHQKFIMTINDSSLPKPYGRFWLSFAGDKHLADFVLQSMMLVGAQYFDMSQQGGSRVEFTQDLARHFDTNINLPKADSLQWIWKHQTLVGFWQAPWQQNVYNKNGPGRYQEFQMRKGS